MDRAQSQDVSIFTKRNPEVSPRVMALIDQMKDLTDDERRAILRRFCSECGRPQPSKGRQCQCWNDD